MIYQVSKKQWSNSGRKRNDIDPLESDFMVQPPSPLEFPGPLTPSTPLEFPIPSVVGVWIFSGTTQFVFCFHFSIQPSSLIFHFSFSPFFPFLFAAITINTVKLYGDYPASWGYIFAVWAGVRKVASQRAKTVVSDSLGLVDFAVGLVIFVLNLPDGQVLFFGGGNSNYKRIVINPVNQKGFLG